MTYAQMNLWVKLCLIESLNALTCLNLSAGYKYLMGGS